MNFLRRLFRRQPQTFPKPSIDVMIARRAERMCNREPKLASVYIRRHSIMAAGRG